MCTCTFAGWLLDLRVYSFGSEFHDLFNFMQWNKFKIYYDFYSRRSKTKINSNLWNSFRCNDIIETGYVYHSITNEDVSSCNDDLQRWTKFYEFSSNFHMSWEKVSDRLDLIVWRSKTKYLWFCLPSITREASSSRGMKIVQVVKIKFQEPR